MRPALRWTAAMASMLLACSGEGPPLPGWVTDRAPFETETGPRPWGDTTDGGPDTPPVCGNEIIEGEEACDGSVPSGVTCTSLGLGGGELACRDCRLDAVGCEPPFGMVLVPEGVFTMGSNELADEQPVREVWLDAFWIDATEVTVADYAECVDDNHCTAPTEGMYCNGLEVGREAHPATCLSWYQATLYCRWAYGWTKRLPTEAEWEKAARGTEGFMYPWGDSPPPSCERAVIGDERGGGDGCGTGASLPVGSKPLGTSPYGAHDMLGNAWEWVGDWYASSNDPSQTTNPVGPSEGELRVLRGGGWYSEGATLRTTFRGKAEALHAYSASGARCASSTIVGAPASRSHPG